MPPQWFSNDYIAVVFVLDAVKYVLLSSFVIKVVTDFSSRIIIFMKWT
jgi:hypothetical protein